MVNIVRWTPRSNDVNRSARTFDQMIDELWRNANQSRSAALRPAMDVIEAEDDVTVRLDLPGLSPDDVNVEVDGDLLTITGERRDEIDDERDHYHHRERRYGAFKRSLRLADTLNAEAIEARFENGVLNIVLPKQPEAQPKRIKVETV